MPFKYVQSDDGKPILPEVRSVHVCTMFILIVQQGMMDLLASDADKDILDLL